MTYHKVLVAAATCALGGCITIGPQVQPFGKDTYEIGTMMTMDGNVRVANGYCAKHQQVMQPEHMSGNMFVFRCVDPAAATTTTWRADAGVSTIQERK
jgi:hypothetical protein